MMTPPGVVARRTSYSVTQMVLLAVAIFVGAAFVRGALLWPRSAGLVESPYDDEGVYAAAAQLLAQGALPYRDYFYGHPPLGPLAYLPAVSYHFTLWGSPTSFLDARYLALVYSALSAALGAALGLRLWGLGGGALTGIVLALDPQSVWTGRHVMLEAPLLLLVAGAALAFALALDERAGARRWLVAAGICGGLAGAMKLPGLVIVASLGLTLVTRRQWLHAGLVAGGVAAVWLPVAGYLIWRRASDPLGQFVWFQLLRPGDGVRGALPRALALLDAAPLALLLGAVGLVALVVRGALNPARVAHASHPPSSPRARRDPGMAATTRIAPDRPGAPQRRPADAGTAGTGRVLLGWWLLLTLTMLFLSRSFYAHYVAQLVLPLSVLAGSAPLAFLQAARAGPRARLVAVATAVTVGTLGLAAGFGTVRADFARHPDAIYQIVGRYVGDAAQPGQAVFALDAQFPFRAARPPARDARGRFIVDGYGSLLYNGLGIAAAKPMDLARGLLAPPLAADPYAVMWRDSAQAELVTAIDTSAIAVVDAKSDGRLTDATRNWLATRGTLVEKQERYAIYRIER